MTKLNSLKLTQHAGQQNLAFKITKEGFADPAIRLLLEEHLRDMHTHTPPEGVFALDLQALQKPEVSFYTCRHYGMLLACGALKEFAANKAEIKSMRTQGFARNRGAAARLLTFLIEESTKRAYQTLFLETGNMAFFEPARQLYKKFGFVDCGPFSDYKENDTSQFMCLQLQ